jgi:hypothetical protein
MAEKKCGHPTSHPWKGIYIYWFGFMLPHKPEIYHNSNLKKLIQPPKIAYQQTIALKEKKINNNLWSEKNFKDI